MASSLNYKKLVFLLVVNGCLFATPHAAPSLLEKVCNKTRDIEFCLHVFGADPATRTASLSELGQIDINKGTDKATKTKAEINKRLFFASDPTLKNMLTQCLRGYDNALAALRIAPDHLRNARYMDLYGDANRAGQGATSCEQGFIDHKLPSPLTRENLELSNYCNILQIIANASW